MRATFGGSSDARCRARRGWDSARRRRVRSHGNDAPTPWGVKGLATRVTPASPVMVLPFPGFVREGVVMRVGRLGSVFGVAALVSGLAVWGVVGSAAADPPVVVSFTYNGTTGADGTVQTWTVP